MFDPNELMKRYKELNNVPKTASEFGIHRSAVYRWINKARCKTGYIRHICLTRKSRAPKQKRTPILPISERIAVEETRIQTGWCAQKITGYLQAKKEVDTSRGFSTIYRFLKRKGMINEEGYHRRPRFQNTKHMHLKNATTLGKLQFDVKYVTPELSGLTHTVFKYAAIDIFSRFKQGIILPALDIQHAIIALQAILKSFPFKPDFIQTDNGLEFQSRFRIFCKDQGMKHHFIHKSTPNENAVIERSFRTDEEEFYFRLKSPPKDLFELNLWYQQYLQEYNNVRPHLGINLKTPRQIVANVVTQ